LSLLMKGEVHALWEGLLAWVMRLLLLFGVVFEVELVWRGLEFAGSAVGRRSVFAVGNVEVVGHRCRCGSVKSFDLVCRHGILMGVNFCN
jgi:hypothetical protein